jgi:hemolysin III
VARTAIKRNQSPGEETANSLSHGIGLVAALAATPYLLRQVSEHSNTTFLVGASVFAASMVLLYLASTLYHALPGGKAKRVFRVIEHSAIYVLIAGTYTPFTLGVLRGVWGWTMLLLIWGLAVTGVMLKAFSRLSHPVASTGLYLLMGWLMVIAAYPLYVRMESAGLVWLVAGGLAYTVGVVFFALDSRLRYSHFVWHLFVLAGTTCHYFALLWYGGPALVAG